MDLGRKPALLRESNAPFLLDARPAGFTLLDFWRWSSSDLLSNAMRGVVAEFIVSKALGCDAHRPRHAWGAYDLDTPEGIRIEVKSAAYLQAWRQPSGLSRITFSIREAFPWNADTNRIGEIRQRSADVYVFCLLKHVDKDTVDPLDLDQWSFFVLSVRALDSYPRSRHSITLPSLRKLTDEIGFEQVQERVLKAHTTA